MVIESWIVVCTDLHSAVGLLHTEEQAQHVADRMTTESHEVATEQGVQPCTYKPVLMYFDPSNLTGSVTFEASSN